MKVNFDSRSCKLRNSQFAIRNLASLWLAALFVLFGLSLQAQCDPEADFTYTFDPLNPCVITFSPTNNGSNVAHEWAFNESSGGGTSYSIVADPIHVFNSGSNTRTVEHKVTIIINGVSIVKTCIKTLQFECTGCTTSLFWYRVNNCGVQFFSVNGNTGQWDFGDNSPTMNGINVVHTYQTGIYTVTFTQNGVSCTKTIKAVCNAVPETKCCTAEFAASLIRDCGILKLTLMPTCTTKLGHSWAITASPCMTPAPFPNFQSNNPVYQITNINTQNTPFITVTHYFDCPQQQTTLISTQNVPIPVDAQNAIFIGLRGAKTPLSNYSCVLPGNLFPNSSLITNPLYVSGIVEISTYPKVSPFRFGGADIFMDPGETGFDVLAGNQLNIIANKVGKRTTIKGIQSCNCLWRGNYALNNGSILTSGATIEDAVFALRTIDDAALSISNTNFNKNFIGVMMADGAVSLPKFQQNTFNGTGPLMLACTPYLTGLVGGVLVPDQALPFIYQNERGYAGMYLANIGTLNLTPLVSSQQNLFRNLGVGIEAKDFNLSVIRNSRFENIQSGTSYTNMGFGTRFVDEFASGANTIRFIGNYTTTADFNRCLSGIQVRSSIQSALDMGTRVNIEKCRFQNRRNAISFSALTNSGTFWGRSSSNIFKGVFNNVILAPEPVHVNASGVSIADFSPTLSYLEVYKNDVKSENDAVSASNDIGVNVVGPSSNQTSVTQIDIYRNKIEVGNRGSGISIARYDRASVRNNSSGPDYPSAGITIAGGASFGIFCQGGANNFISCNNVTSTVSNTNLFKTIGDEDFLCRKNFLSSPTAANIIVEGINGTGSQFRCNDITSNGGIGILYTTGAETGPQGDLTTSFGNKWFGTFANGGGLFSTSNQAPSNSGFFVRNAANEEPTTNTTLPQWVFPNVQAPPICPANECPSLPPMEPPVATISDYEQSVANGTAQYAYAPTASDWWNKYNLYRKLKRNPNLLVTNTTMQAFFNAMSIAPMGKLVDANVAMDNLFAVSAQNLNTLSNIQTSADFIVSQIDLIDSLLTLSPDTLIDYALVGQRIQWLDSLTLKQTAAQSVFQSIENQRYISSTTISSTLESIVTNNVFEENLKAILLVQHRANAMGQKPTAADSILLATIGSQCPFVGGPAVFTARSLFNGFYEIVLLETPCPPFLDEGQSETRNKADGKEVRVIIMPNPANAEVMVKTSALSSVILVNNLGQTVYQSIVEQNEHRINTSAFPRGIYRVLATFSNGQTDTFPLVIQR